MINLLLLIVNCVTVYKHYRDVKFASMWFIGFSAYLMLGIGMGLGFENLILITAIGLSISTIHVIFGIKLVPKMTNTHFIMFLLFGGTWYSGLILGIIKLIPTITRTRPYLNLTARLR